MSNFKNRVLIYLYVYVTLILTRFKLSSLLKINGLPIERFVLIVILFSLVLLLINWREIQLKKNNLTLFILLFIVILIGFYKSNSFPHSLYAFALSFTPMIGLSYETQKERDKNIVFKIFVLINCFYSSLIIFSTINYGITMRLLGNSYSIAISENQHRTGSMVGSSIATSIFQNLSLVMLIYYYDHDYFISKRKYYLIVFLNVISSFILLSRLPFFVMLVLLFINQIRRIIQKVSFKRLLLNTLLICLVYVLFKNSRLNISRLFMGFSDASTKMRVSSLNLGFNIIRDNFFLGSGLGTYYYRVYASPLLNYKDMTALIDPHNFFVLMFSEIGLLGFVIVFMIINYNKSYFNFYSKLLILVMILNGFGGSHLLNNPNIAYVFWFYLGIVINDKKEKNIEDY